MMPDSNSSKNSNSLESPDGSLSSERMAFLEHEANRNVDTWGYLLAEALDEIDRLLGRIHAIECRCGHHKREHDCWSCDLLHAGNCQD